MAIKGIDTARERDSQNDRYYIYGINDTSSSRILNVEFGDDYVKFIESSSLYNLYDKYETICTIGY